ncbi:MAG: zinc-ribbon domain-containing protein [Ginsengibacter sp.]
MIIYGTRNKEIGKEQVAENCPDCGTFGSIDMHVFQKYAHVFWIPVFPIGKTGVSQCDHCKKVLKLKEMPANLKNVYTDLKARSKAPIWVYSGLAAVALFIVLGIIGSQQKHSRNAELILMPRSGDIFEIKNENSKYTLYKVADVQGDSVFIKINDFETDRSSGLKDLKNKSYSEDVFGFSKIELKKMLESGEIKDIDR